MRRCLNAAPVQSCRLTGQVEDLLGDIQFCLDAEGKTTLTLYSHFNHRGSESPTRDPSQVTATVSISRSNTVEQLRKQLFDPQSSVASSTGSRSAAGPTLSTGNSANLLTAPGPRLPSFTRQFSRDDSIVPLPLPGSGIPFPSTQSMSRIASSISEEKFSRENTTTSIGSTHSSNSDPLDTDGASFTPGLAIKVFYSCCSVQRGVGVCLTPMIAS